MSEPRDVRPPRALRLKEEQAVRHVQLPKVEALGHPLPYKLPLPPVYLPLPVSLQSPATRMAYAGSYRIVIGEEFLGLCRFVDITRSQGVCEVLLDTVLFTAKAHEIRVDSPWVIVSDTHQFILHGVETLEVTYSLEGGYHSYGRIRLYAAHVDFDEIMPGREP